MSFLLNQDDYSLYYFGIDTNLCLNPVLLSIWIYINIHRSINTFLLFIFHDWLGKEERKCDKGKVVRHDYVVGYCRQRQVLIKNFGVQLCALKANDVSFTASAFCLVFRNLICQQNRISTNWLAWAKKVMDLRTDGTDTWNV